MKSCYLIIKNEREIKMENIKVKDSKNAEQNVNHDCWEYPKYYEFFIEGDSHRYHGYECEICGKLLQTG